MLIPPKVTWPFSPFNSSPPLTCVWSARVPTLVWTLQVTLISRSRVDPNAQGGQQCTPNLGQRGWGQQFYPSHRGTVGEVADGVGRNYGQPLISGIIAGLSTNESLKATLVDHGEGDLTECACSPGQQARYDDTHTQTRTCDPVPGNAAGVNHNSYAAGVSHNSNAASPSNAAQWGNPVPDFPIPGPYQVSQHSLCAACTLQYTVVLDQPQLPSSQA